MDGKKIFVIVLKNFYNFVFVTILIELITLEINNNLRFQINKESFVHK